MARIKIEDLPLQKDLPHDELKGICGGVLIGLLQPAPQSEDDAAAQAINITLRVWDYKTEQTRQVTIVEDL